MGTPAYNGQCCCRPTCPPNCWLDAESVDPTTAQLSLTVAGVVNADCSDCDSLNGTFNPLVFISDCTWSMSLGGGVTACGTPIGTATLIVGCADRVTEVVVQLGDGGVGFWLYRKTIHGVIRSSDLDGLVLNPSVSDSTGTGNCDHSGSTVTIHVL